MGEHEEEGGARAHDKDGALVQGRDAEADHRALDGDPSHDGVLHNKHCGSEVWVYRSI